MDTVHRRRKSKNTLIYVIKHQSRDAAAAYETFIADSEWKKFTKNRSVHWRVRPNRSYKTTTTHPNGRMSSRR